MKAKGWKREWPANSKEQKAGVSTLISNKIAFHTKCIIKDEWYHVMMMKDSTHREDTVILNLDALLKSVTFSLPSVSPLEFSFPSARDFRHAPCSSFSTQQPVWPSHCSDGSSYNTRFLSVVHLYGAGSSVVYPPSLLLPHHSHYTPSSPLVSSPLDALLPLSGLVCPLLLIWLA